MSLSPALQRSLLSARGLRFRYGSRCVLDGLDLAVGPGEVLAILGPNGAGKTTALSMIAGFLTPESGTVVFHERDVTGWAVPRRVRAGMGVLPQGASVLGPLTVRENMALLTDWVEVDVDAALREAGLEAYAGARAATLSPGLRRRLEVARTLAPRPSVALLDEPFAGIDPIHVAAVQGLVRGARERGAGILLTDHQVRETRAVCDRICVIADGRVLAEGEPEMVLSHPAVRAGYLGHGFC